MFPKAGDKNLKILSDAERANLNRVHQVYLRRAEENNKERVGFVKTFNWKNRVMGTALVLLAAGVYAYTMKAIRQENLGEEYDKTYKDKTVPT